MTMSAPSKAFEVQTGRIAGCRSCNSEHLDPILDLGLQPLANALVEHGHIGEREPLYPLEVLLCQACGLLQVSETVPGEILFGQSYPYFSSFIPALLVHSREHAMALVNERQLDGNDLVVEIASNDGYLLQNFVERSIPVLGIDPASGPAQKAREIGVPTREDFFGKRLASTLALDGTRASVMLANNVLAHVSDINDFVGGFSTLLADDGIAEFEFPYVRDMIEQCAFDTIYHEHVFYYSLTALEPLFGRNGLYLNDVERIAIHGGSLRLRVSKQEGKSQRLEQLLQQERELGLDSGAYYKNFARRVVAIRDDLKVMLAELIATGNSIVAYGAAAKGATLLNYAKLPDGTIDYVVDRNTHKVGKYLPGVQLPIKGVDQLQASPPDYLLVLTWNFLDEIVMQQKDFSDKGGKFLCAIPHPRVIEVEA